MMFNPVAVIFLLIALAGTGSFLLKLCILYKQPCSYLTQSSLVLQLEGMLKQCNAFHSFVTVLVLLSQLHLTSAELWSMACHTYILRVLESVSTSPSVSNDIGSVCL